MEARMRDPVRDGRRFLVAAVLALFGAGLFACHGFATLRAMVDPALSTRCGPVEVADGE
jgi:hypothetical protein